MEKDEEAIKGGKLEMSNVKELTIYEEDLGINFNGYPLEYIDCDEIREVLLGYRMIRLRKNLRYKLVVSVVKSDDNHNRSITEPDGKYCREYIYKTIYSNNMKNDTENIELSRIANKAAMLNTEYMYQHQDVFIKEYL